jgi:glutathione S-transferase
MPGTVDHIEALSSTQGPWDQVPPVHRHQPTSDMVRARLITMPHSHYVEKARWALDRTGLPYREEPHIPLLHRRATGRHGGGSVPVLVHGSICLTDSTSIMEHADGACGGGVLYPRDPAGRQAVDALVRRFDDELGPHARRWAYAQLLGQPALLRPMVSRGVPRLERWLLPLVMPVFMRIVQRAFRITPASAARSLDRVHTLFGEVGALLADGRRFLTCSQFTAADLTFAALASPVLLPHGTRAPYPAPEAVPAAMRTEVLRLRDTPGGRFALRMFTEERASS